MSPSSEILGGSAGSAWTGFRGQGQTGNIQRLLPPVFMDADGAGSFAADFTDPNSSLSTVQPLSQWNLQFWYRDPQPVGNQFNLSDALHMQFCP